MTNLATRIQAAIIITIASLFFFYGFGLNNIFNVLEISIAKYYKLTSIQVGLVSSLYFYSNMLFLIPAGILLDRYSPKVIIIGAMTCCVIGVYLMGSGYAGEHGLMIGRVLTGVGSGFCFSGSMRIAVNWANPKRMGFVSGFIVTMGMLGGYTVQAPLSHVVTKQGWQQGLALVAMIGCGIIMLMLVILRSAPKHKLLGNEKNKNLEDDSEHMHVIACMKKVLLRKYNWLCGIYASMMNLPIYLLGALWGVPYLERVDQMSYSAAASASGILFLGTMVGAILVGCIADWVNNKLLVMRVGAVLAILVFLVLIMVHIYDPLFVDILFFLLGLVTSTQVLAYPMVVEYNGLKHASTATSVVSMMCLGAGAVAQPVFGWLMVVKSKSSVINNIGDGGSAVQVHGFVPMYSVAAYKFAISMLMLTFVLGLLVSFFIKKDPVR